MKKIIITLSIILILGMVIAGCSTPPIEEMQRAMDAVIQAESDPDAVAYAGNTLIRARDALERMQSEADAKRYDVAKEFAAEAIRNAERAIADGQTGAARARSEAESLLYSLGDPMAETSSAVDIAQQAQDLILDFDSLSQDLDSARRTYDEAWQNLGEDNYEDAITNGQDVRSILSDMNGRILEAAQATSRKQ